MVSCPEQSDSGTIVRFVLSLGKPKQNITLKFNLEKWIQLENALQDAAPGPVSGLRVSAIGSDSLQLSWTPPAQPNGHVTSYEITYQLTSKWVWCYWEKKTSMKLSVLFSSYPVTREICEKYLTEKIKTGACAKKFVSSHAQSPPIGLPLCSRDFNLTHDTGIHIDNSYHGLFKLFHFTVFESNI